MYIWLSFASWKGSKNKEAFVHVQMLAGFPFLLLLKTILFSQRYVCICSTVWHVNNIPIMYGGIFCFTFCGTKLYNFIYYQFLVLSLFFSFNVMDFVHEYFWEIVKYFVIICINFQGWGGILKLGEKVENKMISKQVFAVHIGHEQFHFSQYPKEIKNSQV